MGRSWAERRPWALRWPTRLGADLPCHVHRSLSPALVDFTVHLRPACVSPSSCSWRCVPSSASSSWSSVLSVRTAVCARTVRLAAWGVTARTTAARCTARSAARAAPRAARWDTSARRMERRACRIAPRTRCRRPSAHHSSSRSSSSSRRRSSRRTRCLLKCSFR